MEKHVPDSERCKKLKELGVEFPDVKFYWTILNDGTEYLQETKIKLSEQYPAPLVSEMLLIEEDITIEKHRNGSVVVYCYRDEEQDSTSFVGDNVASTVADCLIWLKENGHLEGL